MKSTAKKLMLLRHAKSDWSDLSLDDFDRPLNVRGRKSVDLIARYMIRSRLKPNVIICSTAVRTRETVERLINGLACPLDVIYTDRLYEAGTATLFDIVRQIDSANDSAMIVGHNPGLHAFSTLLMAEGQPDLLGRIRHKYPTGALAEFELAPPLYQHVGPAMAKLTSFVKPKDLK